MKLIFSISSGFEKNFDINLNKKAIIYRELKIGGFKFLIFIYKFEKY